MLREICAELLLLQVLVVVGGFSVLDLVDDSPKIRVLEVSIDDEDRSSTCMQTESAGVSIGERLKRGESVLQLENLVTEEECRYLCEECCRVNAAPTEIEKPGLLRLPTIAAAQRAAVRNTPCADPIPANIDELLQKILARAVRSIDKQIPSIADQLFRGESLAHLLGDNQLKYSSREPAINIYTSGGEFLAHKDAQALTVLLPLSCPDRDFEGGGTAFWSQDSRGHRVEEPTIVLIPPAGTAVLFGGCVTHAGVPVETGTRVVFVASFSSAKDDKPVAIEEHRDIYGDSI